MFSGAEFIRIGLETHGDINGLIWPSFDQKSTFLKIFSQFSTDTSKNSVLDPAKTPLGEIFGSSVFLGLEKHKISAFGGNLEFLGIFQKLKIFENITNIFPKSKIISPRRSEVCLTC